MQEYQRVRKFEIEKLKNSHDKVARDKAAEMALAEKEGVEIRYYSVIYNLLDDVKATLSGMLAPERRETFIGYAKVLQVFNISKLGKVAGCIVTEGVVKRGCGVRLLREAHLRWNDDRWQA